MTSWDGVGNPAPLPAGRYTLWAIPDTAAGTELFSSGTDRLSDRPQVSFIPAGRP